MNDTGLWSLFISALISSTLLPGGSEAVLVYLAQQGQHTDWSLWISATSGNTLGGVITFFMGWWLSRFRPQRIQNDLKLQKSLQRVRKLGSPVLLLSWLPVIGDPLCLAAGWLKASIPISILMILAGKGARYYFLISIT
ncbi:MAG: DedA family protein [Gammaproteobacteria bacterium]|nr:DedA family protein [Gammaproteobacteria bacterium]MDH5691896.1 DedA family protein [Gammaproteobacteria bacterium]